jgi:hypothetical protein
VRSSRSQHRWAIGVSLAREVRRITLTRVHRCAHRRGALAAETLRGNVEAICKEQRFSDHAPITVEYDLEL